MGTAVGIGIALGCSCLCHHIAEVLTGWCRGGQWNSRARIRRVSREVIRESRGFVPASSRGFLVLLMLWALTRFGS